MVTFFTVLDAIRWCIAVQRGLLDITWPEDLLKHPSANKQFASSDNSSVLLLFSLHLFLSFAVVLFLSLTHTH
jgi:hypothetical protein